MSYIIIFPNGNKVYAKDNGDLHRCDGPAATYPDGLQVWWFEGKRHRLDGPAVEYVTDCSNYKRWFFHGEKINVSSQKEFEQFLRLKVFWK